MRMLLVVALVACKAKDEAPPAPPPHHEPPPPMRPSQQPLPQLPALELADGTGGHDPIAIGSGGKKQTRHAPVLWNVAYLKGAFYWDGRAKTLEEVAAAAWAGGNMGVGKDNLDKKAAELAGKYGKEFAAAFGKVPIKGEHVAQALAEYERTMICKDTAYDKFAAGDKAALTEPQQRGLDLFLGKAQC